MAGVAVVVAAVVGAAGATLSAKTWTTVVAVQDKAVIATASTWLAAMVLTWQAEVVRAVVVLMALGEVASLAAMPLHHQVLLVLPMLPPPPQRRGTPRPLDLPQPMRCPSHWHACSSQCQPRHETRHGERR
jgi:hypothetical protein